MSAGFTPWCQQDLPWQSGAQFQPGLSSPCFSFWLQLSHLSNGYGTRWSLSCCPWPVIEFCMNSKEESGYKCILSTLMGLFLW